MMFSNIAKTIKTVLIDLNGTLYIDNKAIKNAIDSIEKLRSSDLKIGFVSNNTKESLDEVHRKLISLNFKIRKGELFTSLTAAHELIKDEKLRPYLLLEDDAKKDFIDIDQENPNAVVVGLAPNHFNYADMNKAFNILLKNPRLIAIHKGRYYKKLDGLHLGPGGFVQALEYATNVCATVVGKPEKQFFMNAVKYFDGELHSTVMIGDDFKDDVSGAIDAGMLGILVKTGKYIDGDETKCVPSMTCDDFSSAIDIILNHQ